MPPFIWNFDLIPILVTFETKYAYSAVRGAEVYYRDIEIPPDHRHPTGVYRKAVGVALYCDPCGWACAPAP